MITLITEFLVIGIGKFSPQTIKIRQLSQFDEIRLAAKVGNA
jgi:hypothetical protein